MSGAEHVIYFCVDIENFADIKLRTIDIRLMSSTINQEDTTIHPQVNKGIEISHKSKVL